MIPPTVILRAATASEVPAVAALVQAAIAGSPYYAARAKAEERAQHDAARLAQRWAEDPDSLLVAVGEGQVLGGCLSRYDDGLVWGAWLAIAPAVRGEGLGRALVQALKASLPRRGAHKLWCDTRTENQVAIHLLLREGFRPLTTLTNHWYGQGFLLWEWTPVPTLETP